MFHAGTASIVATATNSAATAHEKQKEEEPIVPAIVVHVDEQAFLAAATKTTKTTTTAATTASPTTAPRYCEQNVRSTLPEDLGALRWLYVSLADEDLEDGEEGNEGEPVEPSSSSQSSSSSYVRLFEQCRTVDAREDFLWMLRMRMLDRVARRFGCQWIMLGESATRVAIRTLAATSKGRGYTLPWDVGAASPSSPDAAAAVSRGGSRCVALRFASSHSLTHSLIHLTSPHLT